MSDRRRKEPMSLRAFLCIFFLLLPLRASAQAARHQQAPIIDVHLHSRLPEQFAGGVPPNPATGRPALVKNAEEHLRATLAAMKRYHIVKGVVSSGVRPLESIRPWLAAAP